MFRKFGNICVVSLPVVWIVSDSMIEVVRIQGQTFQKSSSSEVSRADETSWVVVDKSAMKICGYEIEKGDLVVLCDPHDPHKKIIRKVSASSEDWIRKKVKDGFKTVFVPKGYCCLENDSSEQNPAELDSKAFEKFPLGLVQGFPLFVIWPLNRYGRIGRQNSNFDADIIG